jgi:hypothetical protein
MQRQWRGEPTCGAMSELPLYDELQAIMQDQQLCSTLQSTSGEICIPHLERQRKGHIAKMTLPSKYQNGSVDSSVKGVYRASPVKLMIYGNGKPCAQSTNMY